MSQDETIDLAVDLIDKLIDFRDNLATFASPNRGGVWITRILDLCRKNTNARASKSRPRSDAGGGPEKQDDDGQVATAGQRGYNS